MTGEDVAEAIMTLKRSGWSIGETTSVGESGEVRHEVVASAGGAELETSAQDFIPRGR